MTVASSSNKASAKTLSTKQTLLAVRLRHSKRNRIANNVKRRMGKPSKLTGSENLSGAHLRQ